MAAYSPYSFLHHPEAFQKYFAASPSIWWSDFDTLEQVHAGNHQLNSLQKEKVLWMSVGELEKGRIDDPPQDSTDIERLRDLLKNFPHLDIKTHEIAQVSHFEAMFPAINLAFKLTQDEKSNN